MRRYLQRTPPNRSVSKPAGNGTAGEDIVPTPDLAWVERLLTLHHQVRDAVVESGRGGSGAKNAKGDDVKVFDRAANDAALAAFRKLKVPVVVDSEESGQQKIGSGTPRHRLVLDPVDGSDNWAQGLPLSALSCAVLPIDAPLHPDSVEAALVGALNYETPLTALMGSGAWRGKENLRTSGIRNVGGAMISAELNHHSPSPGLARLMTATRGVRCYGCASHAISLVAEGAIDAHVDERDRLTAESYLGAARLLIEAGGWVAGLNGASMVAPESLTDHVCLIAASSRDLCHEIVEVLGYGQH